MKKYLLGILAVVLAIGFSAYTTETVKPSMQNTQSLDWHKYNTAGTAELDPVVSFMGTEAEARTEFACPSSGSNTCARAYLSGVGTSTYITKP